jgi:hypothetical protein
VTYSKSTRYGVETDVDLVDKVGGVGDAHERAPRVDIVLPAIYLLIVLQRKVVPFVLGFEK